jgi:hypothetical protein
MAAWGPVWKRQAEGEGQQGRCAEPGCSRRAEPRFQCWHCGQRYCWAHAIERVDESPPRKILCLSCAASAGWL